MPCARLCQRAWPLVVLVTVVANLVSVSSTAAAAAAAASVAAAGASITADPASAGYTHLSEGKKVHVVFANHLDVGFTGWDNETLNAYFHSHIPRALWLADWAAKADPPEKYVWTSHPWLLSLYLDCRSHIGVACPSVEQQQAVRAAMRAGTITWHAAPFNLEWELLPGTAPAAAAAAAAVPGRRTGRAAAAPMWRRPQITNSQPAASKGTGRGLIWSSLEIGRQLDRQMQLPHKTVISLRDVPGLTRAVIPLMAAEGIRLLTVGVNAGSAPPDVPLDKPFLWRDPNSGASLVAIWHAGGYGGSCRDDSAPPGIPELQVACARKCVAVEGLDDVLCLSWRADNQGPPQDSLEVSAVMNLVRRQWPQAAGVATSTLQAYADKLVAAVDGGRVQLPVVEGEIGDTWVYGVASDPLKVANYKAAARARQACAADPACSVKSSAVSRFDRLLLKVPEHTWGLDVKTTLENFNCCGTYDNTNLHSCMAGKSPTAAAAGTEAPTPALTPAAAAAAGPDPPGCGGVTRLTESWKRQAAYVDWALQELPCKHPIVTSYWADMQQRHNVAAMALNPQGNDVLDSSSSSSSSSHNKAGNKVVVRSNGWVVGVDRNTGAITHLCRTPSKQHATARHSTTAQQHSAAGNAADPCAGSHNWAATSSTTTTTSSSSSSGSSRHQRATFASPLYVAFHDADYNVVWNEYAWEGPPNTNPWFKMDLSKPGLNSSWDKHVEAEAELLDIFDNSNNTYLSLQLHYTLPAWLHKEAGAPSRLVILITSPPIQDDSSSQITTSPHQDESSLQLSLVWVNKTATRIPEALWLRFGLDSNVAIQADSWRLHKMGSAINPLGVMRNGSYSMHAVDDVIGVSVAAPQQQQQHHHHQHHQQQEVVSRVLSITPLDSPLVSPGKPLVLPNVRHPPDLANYGVNFNLHNNLWGTNYVMWLPYQHTEGSSGSSRSSSTAISSGSNDSSDSRAANLRVWQSRPCKCWDEQQAATSSRGSSSGSSSGGGSSSSMVGVMAYLQRVLRRAQAVLRLSTTSEPVLSTNSNLEHAYQQQQQQARCACPHSRSEGSSMDGGRVAAAASPAAADAAWHAELAAALADQRVAVFRFKIKEVVAMQQDTGAAGDAATAQM